MSAKKPVYSKTVDLDCPIPNKTRLAVTDYWLRKI
jgi:hypothetical protein